MFEHTTRAQPQRIRFVGYLWRGLVVMEPNLGAPVSGRRVIELDLLAFGNERIVKTDKAKFRFSPRSVWLLHDGPTQSAGFDILVVRCEVLVLHRGELPVLFEEGFVDVDIVVVFPLPNRYFVSVFVFDAEDEIAIFVLHAFVSEFQQPVGDGDRHPAIVASLAGRIDHLEPLLSAAFGVPKHAVLFDPHRRRQDQVGELRRGRRIDVGHDQKLVFEPLLVVEQLVQIRQRLAGIGDLHEERVDVAPAVARRGELLEHFDGVVAGCRVDSALREIPELLALSSVLWIGHQPTAGQRMRQRADFANAFRRPRVVRSGWSAHRPGGRNAH